MNRTAFLFLGLSLSASAFLSLGAGCGGSSGSGTGGTGGTGTTTASGGHGTGGTTSSSSTTGTGGSPAATLDCASYCTEIMANCTADNAQYSGMDTCLASCASFPAGALADVSGDTLGCRIYHGGKPAVMDPVMHCPHAGPSGGTHDPTMAGTCGDPCEAFCNLEAVACTGANQQYATADACKTACKAFPVSTDTFDATKDVSGNNFNCRLYHLTAASTAPAVHCQHTKVGASTSDPCM